LTVQTVRDKLDWLMIFVEKPSKQKSTLTMVLIDNNPSLVHYNLSSPQPTHNLLGAFWTKLTNA